MKACINNQQIRHYNKGVLLEYLYRKKQASKSSLARLAQISIPAVSNILQELEEEKDAWSMYRMSIWPAVITLARGLLRPMATGPCV